MKKAIFIIMILWLSIISGFIIVNEYTIRTGKEVLLETIPIDPRDLIRGDYVTLNYAIAYDSRYLKYKDRQIVYVKLKTNNKNIATIDNIVDVKPQMGLFIQGRIIKPKPHSFWGKCVNFGIESYFVKEGIGLELEKELQNRGLVRVVIDKSGKAKVKGFIKNKI